MSLLFLFSGYEMRIYNIVISLIISLMRRTQTNIYNQYIIFKIDLERSSYSMLYYAETCYRLFKNNNL